MSRRMGVIGVRRSEDGFTLIELAVVVTVLGILVAIGIPTYQRSKDNSEDAACKNNLRSVDGAIVAYRTAYPTDKGPMTWEKLVPEFLARIPECPLGVADSFSLDDRLTCPFADSGPPPRHVYY